MLSNRHGLLVARWLVTFRLPEHVPLFLLPVCLFAALRTESFNGRPIVFREDGYINMTKAAKHFPGKHLRNFWASQETQDYYKVLAEMSGIQDIWTSKKGRYGGTFCHPKLAVFFARWLDVRFAVWCDLMIDNILKGHFQVSVVAPAEEPLRICFN